MKRPLPIRILPPRLRQTLYYRYYHARHARWAGLFREARLAPCPRLAMHDLVVGDAISGPIAFTGVYEPELSRLIARRAARGGLLVDVGANMGYFSLLWAGLGPGNAIAYEAAPRNVRLLQRNVELNGLGGRIAVVPEAAGDRNGTLAFDVGPAAQTGWGGVSATARRTDVEVPVVRLDDALPDEPVSVLKVDVEGADTLVLRGCEGLLRRKRIERIYFEQNPQRMEPLGLRPGEAQALLRSCGYSVAPLDRGQAEWVAHA